MSLILDLIFPKKCLNCGAKGQYLCPKCLSLQKTNQPKYIDKLSKEGSLSLFRYEFLINIAISELKYHFVTDLAEELAIISANLIKINFPHLLKYWQKNNFVLIPIPLHLSRQNWRGFNQSEILVKNLAKKLSLTFSNQVLIRHQNTQIQARLKNIKERTNNVSNIFSLHPSSCQLKNRNFIIFDDVSTTNSTLISAQLTLKDLPVNQCWYLTLSVG